MKTFSKRILKCILAVVLVVLMIASTTVTGFAAALEHTFTQRSDSGVASLGANADVANTGDAWMDMHGGYFYYDNTATNWSDVQLWIGRRYNYGSQGVGERIYNMTKVSNTSNLYYVKVDSWGTGDGGKIYDLFFTTGTSTWGSGWNGENPQSRKNYAGGYTGTFSSSYEFKSSDSYLFYTTASANNSPLNASPYVSGYGAINFQQTANMSVDGTATTDTNVGSVSIDGYYLNGNGTTAKMSTVSGTAPHANLADTSTVTLKATAKTGYTFDGWYDGSTKVSSSATYSYTADRSTHTLTANFIASSFTVNVAADANGSVDPSGDQTVGATPVNISATPSTGYKFVNWTTTGGAHVSSETSATTTLTATANGTVRANFTKQTYTMSFNKNGGSGTMSSQTKTYGDDFTLPSCTFTAPANKRFSCWALNSASGTHYNAGAKYTGNANATFYAVWVDAGSCELSFDVTSDSGVINQTKTHTATGNSYHKGTISYSSSDSSIASVNATTGAVTGLKPGTVTITATCTDTGSTGSSYEYTVLTPTVSLALTPASVNIGNTSTASATVTNAAASGGSTTYSSGTTAVATISGTTITAKKDGTSVITATYTVGSQTYTATKTLTVNAPSFSAPANQTLNFGQTYTITDPTVTNPGKTGSFSYSVKSGDAVSLSGKVVTPVKAGTSTINCTYTTNGNTYTKTFNVTVNAPTPSITPDAINMIVGQSSTVTLNSTEPYTSVDWSASGASVTLSPGTGNATVTGASEGTATVSATVHYSPSYSVTTTANCTVTVAPADFTVSPTALTLEEDGAKKTADFTVTLPESALGAGTVNATSATPSVATVTDKGDGTFTVTAQSVGSTQINVTWTPAGGVAPITKTVDVTVNAYDPNQIVYFTGNDDYNDVYLHVWGDNGNLFTIGSSTDNKMVYIGKNGDGKNVYAMTIPKEAIDAGKADNIIFVNKNSWSDQIQSKDAPLTFDPNNAYYPDTKDGGQWKVGRWTFADKTPTVSLADKSIAIAVEDSLTATVQGTASSYAWNIGAGTGDATLGTSTTDTVSIIGTQQGDVTVGVRAFAQIGDGCSLKSLNTTDPAAYPYISTYAEATVSVTAGAPIDTAIYTQYANDIRNDYQTGANGGTVTLNGTPIDPAYAAEVLYGTTYNLVATPKTGYAFVGWYDAEGTCVDVSATKTVQVTGEVELYARFVKSASLTLTPVSGITYSTNVANLNAIPVGTQVNVTTTLAENHIFVQWTVKPAGVSATDANPSFVITADSTLTPEIEATYTMNAFEVVIDPKSATATVGNATINNQAGPVYVSVGEQTTFKYEQTANTDDFVFLGWYYGESETDITRLVSKDTTFETIPTGDITLFAVLARKYYVIGDMVGGWDSGNAKVMTYDPVAKVYTYVSNVPGDFKIAPTPSASDNSTWRDSSTDRVTYGTHEGVTSLGWADTVESGHNNARIGDFEPTYGAPITITWKPESQQNRYELSCKASETGGTVILSDGRSIADGVTPTSRFVDLPDGTVVTDMSSSYPTVGGSPETGHKFTANELQAVSVETALSGTNAANFKISAYVVYDKQTGHAYAVTDVADMGNNKYAATIPVKGTSYIYPVTEYKSATDYIYVDASSIGASSIWGPLVAAYLYTDDTNPATQFNGLWPAQLMIPSDDGLTWYMKIPAAANGVVFNNFMDYSLISDNKSMFGLSNSIVQTYDYSEMTVLKKAGKSAITFVLKENKDSYHGDFPDPSNYGSTHVVQKNENISIPSFGFDWLYHRDGVTPMTFMITDKPANPAETLYVVSKGDVDHSGTVGKWAVDWYIYDSNGNYLTSVVSNALYDGNGDANKLVQALHSANSKYTAAYLEQCAVKISYDAVNKWNNNDETQKSYDGQWYGNEYDDTMTVDVLVGLIDNGVYDVDDDNEADYGTAYLFEKVAQEYTAQSIEVPFNDNTASMKSNASEGYRFNGWYVKNADGSYTKVSSYFDYTVEVMNDKTFYAFFERKGTSDFTVTNQIYKNSTETEILSHNGTAIMTVAIYSSNAAGEKGTLLAKGDASKQISTSNITTEEDAYYYVEVTATPQNQGSFFAFYTDSTDKSGAATYEEVMTTAEMVGSTTLVSNHFIYQAVAGAPTTINIYTDVTKVENKAMLVYKYRSRVGAVMKTYTVPEVLLTDEECAGFEGNEFKEYTPAYLTKYVMTNDGGATTIDVYGTQNYNTMMKAGYVMAPGTTPYNKVEAYSPTYNAANVWNEILKWDVESVDKITTGKSIVTLIADQRDEVYTITYTVDGASPKEQSGIYNTLCVINEDEVPYDIEGRKFAYWVNADTDEVLSTERFFGMRIIKDLAIDAVYLDYEEDRFVPMIDTTAVTREYSDTSDVLFTDYLVHFASTVNGKAIGKGVATTYNDIDVTVEDYGLILMTERNYDMNTEIDHSQFVYPSSVGSAAIGQDMEAFASTRTSTYNAQHGSGNYYYYYYTVSGKPLTIFNRTDYVLSYDNLNTKYNYRNWTFTGFAFIKYKDANGNYYFDYSAGSNVELFTKGNADPSDVID